MTRFFFCFFVALILLFNGLNLYGNDFSRADSLFNITEDYTGCRVELEKMLNGCDDKAKCAEIHWRLSRLCLLEGEATPSKQDKGKKFNEGIALAAKAIEEDPSNPYGYMWHCANTGRECQLHSLMEQARSVSKMMKDLDMILEKLGRTDCSEAWQAKAEIYYNHPFKSDDEAIGFMRKAVSTIPSDELRLSTSIFLAKLLSERNKKGDKDEAASVLAAAKKKYDSSSRHYPVDDRDYELLLKAIDQ